MERWCTTSSTQFSKTKTCPGTFCRYILRTTVSFVPELCSNRAVGSAQYAWARPLLRRHAASLWTVQRAHSCAWRVRHGHCGKELVLEAVKRRSKQAAINGCRRECANGWKRNARGSRGGRARGVACEATGCCRP